MKTSGRRSFKDRGDTLVEVLLALIILGLAGVALIVAFETSINASAEHRNLSEVTTAITNVTTSAYSEVRILDATTDFFAPPQQLLPFYVSNFDPALDANLPSGFTAQVVSVQYWNAANQDFESGFVAYQPQLMTVDITNNNVNPATVTVHGVILTDPTQVAPVTYGTTPTKLVFAVEPSGATLNTNFTTQPAVVVEDAAGNIVPSALPYITITISSGTDSNGAVLSSTCAASGNGTGVFVYNNCSINELGTGYELEVDAFGSYWLSTPFNVTSVALNVPTITNVTASSTTAGALSVTFTGSSNAPPGQNYVMTACTDSQMTQNCRSASVSAPGGDIPSLVQGTPYYVQVQAAASLGYIAATSPTFGPVGTSSQLLAPTNVTLGYGTVVGSLIVNFTGSSNAPIGVTYSATACTDLGMTQNCVTNASIASGGQIPLLNFSSGQPGTPYYVTVSGNAILTYIASPPSGVSAPHADTSSLIAPTNLTLASSTTTAGAATATFTAPTGTAPSSYSAKACTDVAMTLSCVIQASYVSSGQFTGLIPGTNYYFLITANPPSGYVSSSVESAGTILATTQLTSPTAVTPGYGTVAGSISVNFTGSSNAPGGQTYSAKACTNAGMTTGCVSNASIASGGQITGLLYTTGSAGTSYFVTVSANASSGYLASAASTVTATAQAATSIFSAPTLVTPSYGTTAGSLTVTFTGSTGVAPTSYSAMACTDLAMTQNCVTTASIASGGQIIGLAYVAGSAGTSYHVTVSANASSGFLASAASAVSGSHAATSVLNAPTNLNLASSTTTAGAVTATFTAPANTAPSSYSATACTDVAMSLNCVTLASYLSGGQFSGLTPGTNYYVVITANGPSGFLNSSVESAGTILATSQLTAPTGVTLGYGTVAGSVSVTFTGSSNAAGGQIYSATACTNNLMTLNCVTSASIASGGQITSLAYVAGSAGTSYFVTVSATASSGYLVSAASSVSAAHAATSILKAPTGLTLASSTTTAGAVTASYTAPTGTAPTSYSATACTDLAMTLNCVTKASYASGGQLSGLTPGTSYYVVITANAPSGYLISSVESAGTVLASSQLNAPTTVTLGYGTIAGSVSVTFTGSSNAPGGQTYSATACTNNTMTIGCVTNASIASGGQIAGLAYVTGSAGTSYFVTVSANASSGYLTSAVSAVTATAQPATSIFNTPTAVTLGYGTTAGSISVTFTAPTGSAPTSYSAKACTNNVMTLNCVTTASIASGGQITGLTYVAGSAGTSYFVTVSANASSGYLASAASAVSGSHAATSALNVPTNLTLASSTTTAGAVTATFTAPTGTAPTSYSATACTDLAMTLNCVTQASYTSASQFSGLTPGTNYYVVITANAPGGYVNSSVESAGTVLATSQLTAPTAVTLGYGTVAGSVSVTFTGSSNAPGGQTYSATACTNNIMTLNCVTNASIASGGQITGLTYVAGSAGTSYFVTVSANASGGYLASAASTVTATAQPATSIFIAPTAVTLGYGTTAGSITVTFTGSTGTAPTSYSAKACTNNIMTLNCVTNASIASGGQITGLAYVAGSAGTSYFVTVSANASGGYLASAASTVTATAQPATSMLNVPTSLTLTHINNASIRANYTAPTGTAPSSYTALVCTNAGLTTGCLAPITGYTSGATINGVASPTNYYVQITAIAAGYISSAVSNGPVVG
jgi:type II secretory pathway pseudopilin PulG